MQSGKGRRAVAEPLYARVTGQKVTLVAGDRRTVVGTFGLPYTVYELHELNSALLRLGCPVLSRWLVITNPDGLVLEAAVKDLRTDEERKQG